MDTLTSFITTHKLQGYEAIPAFIAANPILLDCYEAGFKAEYRPTKSAVEYHCYTLGTVMQKPYVHDVLDQLDTIQEQITHFYQKGYVQ